MSTKDTLSEANLRPKKRFGQHFLADERILQRILAAAEVGPEDIVLEIGPGLGSLTRALAGRARLVLGVEIDEQLVALLCQQLSASSHVRIVAGDIMAVDIVRLLEAEIPDLSAYKVVANIPYNITAGLLRRLLEASRRPQLIVLMVQHEVAQRITAAPGQMSLLSVSVQFYGRPRVIHRVPAGAFYPPPKVDSAIVRIDPHEQLPLVETEVDAFFAVVRAGFSQRRKQLRNALAGGLRRQQEEITAALVASGIAEQRRAQTLSMAEWLALYRALCAPRG